MHAKTKEEIPAGWVYRQPVKKGGRKGNNKKRPRGYQILGGNVGRLLVAATALTGAQLGPSGVDGLQFQNPGNNAFDSSQRFCCGLDCSCETKSGLLAADVKHSRGSGYSVDSSVEREKYEIEPTCPFTGCENTLWPYSEQSTSEKKLARRANRKTYSIQAMIDYCGTEERRQECLNSLAYNLAKAFNHATEVGQARPPEVSEDDPIATTIFGARATASDIEACRSWDTGATFGMSLLGENPEIEYRGRQVRIATGNSVVKSDVWCREATPWGEIEQICLRHTAKTTSAGDCNRLFGAETSWLAPAVTPSDPEHASSTDRPRTNLEHRTLSGKVLST